MTIRSSHFGTLPDGKPVVAHTLSNRCGASLQAISYGGIVTSLKIAGRDGRFADIVLGFDRLQQYLSPANPYMGAITGRVAGRIPGGRFTLAGTTYQLALNDGRNHLHGGVTGLDKRLWGATPLARPDGTDALRLHYFSPDGEEGYPGNVDISVTYTLTDDNEFIIETEATSDRPTPLSLTHHSYFNLAGEGGILDHELQVDAGFVVEIGDAYTPTGQVVPVASRAGDLQAPRRLGDIIPGLHLAHGDLYVLGNKNGIPARVARLRHPSSGRAMTVSTTEHCLQVYTSSAFDGTLVGRSGKPYPPHSGICFECEGYPDSLNTPGFGDLLVRPGQPQRNVTIYAFSID